jgi:rhamnosyltransferase
MPVCITGMHRSGTSMVAHALSRCGLDLGPPEELLPANVWNEGGYWENRSLVDISDWLLEQLGGSWDVPPRVSDKRRRELRSAFEDKAQSTLSEVDFREPWGWKDPRVCLVADFWSHAVEGLRYVVLVRNPVDVTLSLQRRGAGSSAHLWLAMWATYYTELLRRVPPGKRMVIDHAAFVSEPANSLQLVLEWLRIDSDPGALAEAAAVVDRAQIHHASDRRSLLALPEDVRMLYAELVAEAQGSSAAEHRVPPPPGARAQAAVRELESLFASYHERDGLRDEVLGLTADRDNWKAQAEAVEDDRKAWQAEVERLREHATALETDRDEWQSRMQHTEGLLESTREEIGRLVGERDGWIERAQEIQRERDELDLARERLREQTLALEADRGEWQGRLQQAEGLLEATREEIGRLVGERDGWVERAQEIQRERDEVSHERDRLREQTAALEADRGEWQDRLQQTEGLLDAAREEIGRLVGDRDSWIERVQAVQGEHETLVLDRERLRELAAALEADRGEWQDRAESAKGLLDSARDEIGRLVGERDGWVERIGEIERERDELVHERDRLREQTAALEADRSESQGKLQHAEGLLDSARDEVGHLVGERDGWVERIGEIEREHEELVLEHERVRFLAEFMEEKQKLVSSERDEWRERAQTLSEEAARAVQRHDALFEETDRLVHELASTRAELQEAAETAAALLAENQELARARDDWQSEAEGLSRDRDNWREEAERLADDRDNWRSEAEHLTSDRDSRRAEAEQLAHDRDHWRDEAGLLAQDRDNWESEARHWRSETERLVSAEQLRLRWRLRRACLRIARRIWWVIPAALRNRLRPLLFPSSRQQLPPAAVSPDRESASPPELPPAAPARARAPRAGADSSVGIAVSLVVPTLNAGSDAELFLAALDRQDGVPDVELVVADSGSTDGTRERLIAAGAHVLDVAPGDFGHGRTRNEAVAASSGEVVAMMVQDALLLGRHALRDLVLELLADERTAAVSARQVPRSNADLFAAFTVVSHHRALWRDGPKAAAADPLRRRAAAAVDDVCVAIRRSVWEQGLQYRDVEFGEDLDFGLRAVEAGWTIGLSEKVSVAHSHTRDAVYHFRRSIADRLNIAPLVGDVVLARSAGHAAPGEIAFAGRALVSRLAAALSLSSDSHERLSNRFVHVTELLRSAAVPTAPPPAGELAALDAFFGEIEEGAATGETVNALCDELVALFDWPLLVEFTEAQRGISEEAVADFAAKLAASVVGRAVGDRLRLEDSPATRKRLLVGV